MAIKEREFTIPLSHQRKQTKPQKPKTDKNPNTSKKTNTKQFHTVTTHPVSERDP